MNLRASGPRRIAFCITELEPGGAERNLVELATRIDRARFEPVVYCLGPRPGGNGTSLADVLEHCGVRVVCFGAGSKLRFLSVLRRLRRQMAIDRPQLVQGFLFHANVLATIAARRSGVPHMVTGIRVAERRGGWHLAAARWTDRWVERHVCVSQAVRDFSCRVAGLPAEKLVVIYNGVDIGRFATAKPVALSELGIAASRRLMTHVGRLDEQKGAEWLVERMPQIFARPDVDLLLVGEGPQRTQLERRVRGLGLAGRVHFAGFRRDVPEILAASDVLVLASRWEGMPNVVLEAMAAGKPVVAADVEGVAEALGPAAAAQTAPPLDAEAFVSKVLTVLDEGTLAARLGRENQERARAFFSLGSMCRAYEQLYASLLSDAE